MKQLEDNDKLLEKMMNDFWKQEKKYQADKFWKGYENWNLRTLRDYGLSNFLSRQNSFGSVFTREFIFPRYIALALTMGLGRIANLCRKMKIKTHPFNVHGWVKDNPAGIRQLED